MLVPVGTPQVLVVGISVGVLVPLGVMHHGRYYVLVLVLVGVPTVPVVDVAVVLILDGILTVLIVGFRGC